MKRILIAMLLMFVCSTSFAAQERVVNLPQDGGMWYVSIFGTEGTPQFQKVQNWFNTDAGLVDLKKQTHFNIYSTKNLRFQRYAKQLPGLACVRVQNSKGVVVSEFWAQYMPSTGNELLKGIQRDMQRRTQCPWARPDPEPAPEPAPAPVPVIDTPPEMVEPEPEQPGFPILLAIVAALVGAGVGVGQGFKEEHFDSPSMSLKSL